MGITNINQGNPPVHYYSSTIFSGMRLIRQDLAVDATNKQQRQAAVEHELISWQRVIEVLSVYKEAVLAQ